LVKIHRVSAKTFFDYVTTGENIDTYLEDYPYVTREQVQKLLSLMYRLLQKTTEKIFNTVVMGKNYRTFCYLCISSIPSFFFNMFRQLIIYLVMPWNRLFVSIERIIKNIGV
jgi:hypothetical protein